MLDNNAVRQQCLTGSFIFFYIEPELLKEDLVSQKKETMPRGWVIFSTPP